MGAVDAIGGGGGGVAVAATVAIWASAVAGAQGTERRGMKIQKKGGKLRSKLDALPRATLGKGGRYREPRIEPR